MDPSSLSVATFMVATAAGSPVAAAVTYDAGSRTATCTPSAALNAAEVFTATVTTGAKDAAGNELVADYVWSFTTAGTWVQIGGQVGPGTASSEDPTMLVAGGTPAVGYRHDSYRTYLNVWAGTDWGMPEPDPTGSNTQTSQHSTPSFCAVGTDVYMAYSRVGDSGSSGAAFYDRVFARRWTGAASWSALNSGDEVSQPYTPAAQTSAYEPAIAGTPWADPVVAWIEAAGTGADDDLWVAEVGASSITRYGAVNRNNNVGSYPTDVRCLGMTVDPVAAYVAHWEQHHNDPDRTDLYVTACVSGNYFDLDDAIASDYDAANLSIPSLVATPTHLYVAYSTANSTDYTRHVYVQRWDGAAWTMLGGGPVSAFSASDHYDSGNPDLALAGGTLYLAWDESSQTEGPFIFVARWDGASGEWVLEGDRLNVDPDRAALDPNLAFSSTDDYLYVAFEELVGGAYGIFVKRRIANP